LEKKKFLCKNKIKNLKNKKKKILSLKPIQSKLNSNLNVKLNLYFRFLINKSVPLSLKKYVLISFILSLVIYYAPLFGSNKSRCSIAQKIINRGLYWSLRI